MRNNTPDDWRVALELAKGRRFTMEEAKPEMERLQAQGYVIRIRYDGLPHIMWEPGRQ